MLWDLNDDLSLASNISYGFLLLTHFSPQKSSFFSTTASFDVCLGPFSFQSGRHIAVCDDECCLYHFGDRAECGRSTAGGAKLTYDSKSEFWIPEATPRL